MTDKRSSASDAVTLGRIGFEIELLAPRGRSRLDLANAIADHFEGNVRRFFHPQGELSKAANTPFFENLTLGFVVEDDEGTVLAQCVDDFTLKDDLDQAHPPQTGWYRIVSDDARFLRLTAQNADATESLESVLNPVAALFGTTPGAGVGGMVRVADETGAAIVMGATLPGERERPCELITPPIDCDHLEQLEVFMQLARELKFTIPAEGAIHLHFDATPLCDATTLANLVRFLSTHTEALKAHFETNPRCRRLGMWPKELLELVNSPGFTKLQWEEVQELLRQLELTKYCDFNLRNLIYPTPEKHTFEVRILPVWLESEKIIEAATVFTAILKWARSGSSKSLLPVPENLDDVIPAK